MVKNSALTQKSKKNLEKQEQEYLPEARLPIDQGRDGGQTDVGRSGGRVPWISGN